MAKSFSHPALTRRAQFLAENNARHPRLQEGGLVTVSDMPSVPDLIGLRPLTIEEQIARFDSGVTDYRLIPDENFMSEDDFHDHLDGIPTDGLTPYELEGFKNIEFAYSIGRPHAEKLAPTGPSDVSATPTAEPSTPRPQKAGGVDGDTVTA